MVKFTAGAMMAQRCSGRRAEARAGVNTLTRLFQAGVDFGPILGLGHAVLEGFPRQEEASQGSVPTKMGVGSTFSGHAMTRNSLPLTSIGY